MTSKTRFFWRLLRVNELLFWLAATGAFPRDSSSDVVIRYLKTASPSIRGAAASATAQSQRR